MIYLYRIYHIFIYMKQGKIKQLKYVDWKIGIQWTFEIDFDTKVFWPYTYVFHRKNLYFNEETNERGSYFFPLKNKDFDNTELFLETNDIVEEVFQENLRNL